MRDVIDNDDFYPGRGFQPSEKNDAFNNLCLCIGAKGSAVPCSARAAQPSLMRVIRKGISYAVNLATI
jgi:hypothetical protein